MSIAVSATKHAVHDQIESQIRSAGAKLEALRARAEGAKATAELKTIATLVEKRIELSHKLDALMKAGENKWEHQKTELEQLIGPFEKSIRELEAKVKV